MRIPLNPVMASLLAAFLPTLPAAALAAERGQVVNTGSPGGRTTNVNANDAITYDLSLIHI